MQTKLEDLHKSNDRRRDADVLFKSFASSANRRKVSLTTFLVGRVAIGHLSPKWLRRGAPRTRGVALAFALAFSTSAGLIAQQGANAREENLGCRS